MEAASKKTLRANVSPSLVLKRCSTSKFDNSLTIGCKYVCISSCVGLFAPAPTPPTKTCVHFKLF